MKQLLRTRIGFMGTIFVFLSLLLLAVVIFAPIWKQEVWNGQNLLPEKFVEESCWPNRNTSVALRVCRNKLKTYEASKDVSATKKDVLKRQILVDFEFGPMAGDSWFASGEAKITTAIKPICSDCPIMRPLIVAEVGGIIQFGDWVELKSTPIDEFENWIELRGIAITLRGPTFYEQTHPKRKEIAGPYHRKRLINQGIFPLLKLTPRPSLSEDYSGTFGEPTTIVFLQKNPRCETDIQLVVSRQNGQALLANIIATSFTPISDENIAIVQNCVRNLLNQDGPVAEFRIPLVYFDLKARG